eukprot:CAMPEP_0118875610 /NCGR_PEP_ID=MMETSP1163-20130328/16621_1 /TAXON_ID=124430 /ORGANISM="Phaeomonas parva, Strain CCMP2877" /LENGTH=71 /DNA_ID=CAMNT_0006811129 /DNA_START=129 /DNA_END=345 /DNA_ORIENTATION=-
MMIQQEGQGCCPGGAGVSEGGKRTRSNQGGGGLDPALSGVYTPVAPRCRAKPVQSGGAPLKGNDTNPTCSL